MFCPGSEPSLQVAMAGSALVIAIPVDRAAVSMTRSCCCGPSTVRAGACTKVLDFRSITKATHRDTGSKTGRAIVLWDGWL